jgi:hypothetical protein
MSPTGNNDPACIGTQRAAQIIVASASCADTAEHVRQSKLKIARSLDLLTSTAHQIRCEDLQRSARADEDRWGG